MLQTSGIQIIPLNVQTEPGTLRADDKDQPAVLQTFLTQSGPVQVVIPIEAVDQLIDGIQKAKEMAEKEGATKSGDLYIPGSAEEVNKIAEDISKLK